MKTNQEIIEDFDSIFFNPEYYHESYEEFSCNTLLGKGQCNCHLSLIKEFISRALEAKDVEHKEEIRELVESYKNYIKIPNPNSGNSEFYQGYAECLYHLTKWKEEKLNQIKSNEKNN